MSIKDGVVFRVFMSTALLTILTIAAAPAHAMYANGSVLCDADANGVVSSGDLPVADVVVHLVGNCGWGPENEFAVTTDTGSYEFHLGWGECTYTETLQEGTIPYTDWDYLIPPSGASTFTLIPDGVIANNTEWLLGSIECSPLEGRCWLTAGGVKFSPMTGAYMDEYRPKAVEHSWGGNVNPACAPIKGHWNHIAHKLNLHFQASDIEVLQCGNVAGIPPGSESPVTPVNFIEFTSPVGKATLKGINGNKVNYGNVCYFARAEDRNEPGSSGAKEGSLIDRYFLRVYNCDNPSQTLLLVDIDQDSTTVDPITITGGNMQMHFKPCDN